MRKEKHTVIGLCAVFGMLCVPILIIALFSRDPGWLWPTRTYTVRALFDRAVETPPGTRVTVGGIPVGRVRRVGFADPDSLVGGTVVELALNRDHRLRAGSHARAPEALGSTRPRIDIIPGPSNNAPLENGATISGEVISSLSTVLSPELASTIDKSTTQVGDAAESLRAVLNDFHTIVQPTPPAAVDRVDGPPGNLFSAAARLDAALTGLNAVLADSTVQSEIKETLHNVHAISVDLRQTVANAKDAFARVPALVADSEKLVAQSHGVLTNADERIDGVSRNLNQTIELVSTLLKEIDALAAKIGRGEGTVGKLIGNDQVHEALLLALRRMAAEKP